MSDKPSKDIDPHVIDQPLLNNPKLALLFTDYQEVINLFPGESLLAYARKHVDTTHDPVTSEKNFYLGLNDTGVKLKTIDNPDIDYDKLKTERPTNTVGYTEQPDQGALDMMSNFKMKDILDVDVQIILYWVEKFRCIHDTVKQEIWLEIPKEDDGGAYDNTNTYFNNFNESFFSIRDSQYIKDRATVSYLDPLTPREQFNKNMMGKIDMETYNTSNEMSSKIDRMFHANMIQLCTDVDRDARHSWIDQIALPAVRTLWTDDSKTKGEDPSLPHGNNNVVDSIHLGRIEANIDAVQLKMNDILGDMKRVFDFLDKNTSDDTQEWGRYNRQVLKNVVWVEVDQSLTELQEIFPEQALTVRKNHDLS